MIFETDRVRLRKCRASDADLYNAWSNDEIFAYFTHPCMDKHSQEETDRFFDTLRNSKRSKSYMVETRKEAITIGITSLIDIDPVHRNAEFIIDLGDKDYWGRKLGREAASLMLGLAFCELDLHRVSLKVFAFNERAIKLYRSLGFVEEGRMREALFRGGKRHDIILMGMLQSEYADLHAER